MYLTSQLAKEYGLTENKLKEILRNNDIPITNDDKVLKKDYDLIVSCVQDIQKNAKKPI